MDINNLNKSISEMSKEELQSTMLEIRKHRRTTPKKKSKAKTKPKKQLDLFSMIEGMDEDARLSLIKEIEGG